MAVLDTTSGIVYLKGGAAVTFTSANITSLNVDTITLDLANDDVVLSRGAANQLDLAVGDSFHILGGKLSVAHGTITTDLNTIGSTVTWNNAGVTFTGLEFNATDTASNAASLLFDFQVGGTSKGKLDKAGTLTLANQLSTAGNVISGGSVSAGSGASPIFWLGVTQMSAPADGQWNLSNNAISAGIGLDVATDAVMKVRTRAQTGYATVDALGYKASGTAGASGTGTVISSITVTNGIVTAISVA